MKGKNAQGLSLNMVVVGAIALIVLVVILVIFIGGMNPFRNQIKHAPCSLLPNKNPNTLKGYSCSWEKVGSTSCQKDYTAYVTSDDVVANPNKKCCCKKFTISNMGNNKVQSS